MALLKAVFFLALCCLAQGVPEFRKPRSNDLQEVLTVTSNTQVSGSNQQPLAEVDLTLCVSGDYNNNTDKHVVTNFLNQKLSSLQGQDAEEETGMNLMAARNGLPLAFNLTLTEFVTLGPRPKKHISLTLTLEVYVNRHHRNQTMAILQHIKPSF